MIYVLSGGGTGATLVITGVAGDTCTITKDSKSKSKTFDSSGKATFKGLDTGTWTVKMTSTSGSTATRTVTVNTDYTLAITYFSAAIAVTYPEGSTCTCSDGNTTLTAPDTSGAYTFTVGNTGTWTVTCTNGTDTASEAVSITADGQTKTVTLLYELVLFDADDGGDNTTVTGGWNSIEESSSTINYTQPYSYLYLKNVWRSTLYPKNTVDVTKFTKLNVSVKKTAGDNSKAWVTLTATKPATNPSTSITVGTGLDIASYTEQTSVALDISANSGANYIVLYCNFTEVAIYRIWLT